VQFFFEELPGVEQHGGMGERARKTPCLRPDEYRGRDAGEGFPRRGQRDKRKLISSIARVIAETKE
jgi:hypothetical protein